MEMVVSAYIVVSTALCCFDLDFIFLYDLDFSFVKIFLEATKNSFVSCKFYYATQSRACLFFFTNSPVHVYGFVLGRTKVPAWVQRFNGPGLPNPMHVRSQAQPNGCQSASMLPYCPQRICMPPPGRTC